MPSGIANWQDLRDAIYSHVPSHLHMALSKEAEAGGSIEEAAGQLPRRWTVSDELQKLREHLEEDERIELMAEATIGYATAGLLTLTDRKLIYLARPRAEGRQKEIVMRREAISQVTARGPKLVIRSGGGEGITLKDIVPSERAGEIAGALGGLVRGRDWAGLRRVRPLAMAGIAATVAGFGYAIVAWGWSLGALGDVVNQGGLGRRVPPAARWMNRAALGIAVAAAVVAPLRG